MKIFQRLSDWWWRWCFIIGYATGGLQIVFVAADYEDNPRCF